VGRLDNTPGKAPPWQRRGGEGRGRMRRYQRAMKRILQSTGVIDQYRAKAESMKPSRRRTFSTLTIGLAIGLWVGWWLHL
jgi:hypothetical protein